MLSEYAAFIGMLKDRGLYDSTALLFISDHGIGRPLSNPSHFPESDSSLHWAENRELSERAVDRFRPMMMQKPFDRRGDLRFSSAQIHQVNLPATLLELAGIASPYRAEAISEIPKSENRPRSFTRTFGRTRRNEVSDYDEYLVTGPSNDYRSYRKLDSSE